MYEKTLIYNERLSWAFLHFKPSMRCRNTSAVCVCWFEPLWLTWHLMSMSKKSSSGSLLSALAMSWLSTSWLLFWSSSNPGSVPMLARCSSSRRPCELASKSRKWPGWADAASSDTEIATGFFFLKGKRRKDIFLTSYTTWAHGFPPKSVSSNYMDV